MASAEESSEQTQYNQEVKKECRKKLIGEAVKALTTERETSTCVRRDHVRKAWQQLRESQETSAIKEQEIAEIEEEIKSWEDSHDSKVQTKKASELRVCYLAGDNPLNDFNIFVENGVLSKNIWAIENDAKTFEKARENMKQAQEIPNVFKGDFLEFLKFHKDKFDIIYFDACGSLPSEKQETLKAIGYVFLHDKLTSPGALITTFSFPPKQTEEAASNASQDKDRKNLTELSRQYLKHRLVNTSVAHKIPHYNEKFLEGRADEENYSEYLVYQIIDTAYMYIPALNMLSPNKDGLLQQSFGKKGHLKKAIKHLSQVLEEEKESASKSLNKLKILESLIPKYEKKLGLLRGLIRKGQIRISDTEDEIKCLELELQICYETRILLQEFCALLTEEELEYVEMLRGLIQKVEKLELLIEQKKNDLQKLQLLLDKLMDEEKSKEGQLDKLKCDKKEQIQDLSLHEAQPPRYLTELGHNLNSSNNSFFATWATEVFPDWTSSTDFRKWKLSLITHLLTNWIALIDKCSNKYFKDFLQPIIEFLGDEDGDGDGGDNDIDSGDGGGGGGGDGGGGGGDGDGEYTSRWRRVFSQLVDVPNKEVTKQMIATLFYGQMACPSFPVLEKLKRFRYTAKKRQMFSNLFIFDKCRYVYEHFPSVHISTSVSKPHKQMVFRMAVDGLRKHVQHICNEDVFKCCNVVEEGTHERVPVIPECSEITTQSHDDLA